jgi:hypothetical protein
MYYPKSQIKTNLFTNGGDYILLTTNEAYKGYYYEISSGQTYTGKNPQDGPNILLTTPINVTQPTEATQETPIIYALDAGKEGDGLLYEFDPNVYFDLTNENNSNVFKFIPLFNPTLPTPQDNQNGQFNRYFCKKNNETRYLEIDKNTYQQLQKREPKIAWDLYTPIIVLWITQGNQTQVFNSNKATVQAIETNAKWDGFSQYFQEKYLKYYLGS